MAHHRPDRTALARRLKQQGMSYRDVGRRLGITPGGAMGLIMPKGSSKPDGICQNCGDTVGQLHRHHSSYDKDPDELLCPACHGKKPKERLVPIPVEIHQKPIFFAIDWHVRRQRVVPKKALRFIESLFSKICHDRAWRMVRFSVEGSHVSVIVQVDYLTSVHTVYRTLTRESAKPIREKYKEFRTLPSVWTLRYQAKTLSADKQS